MAKSLGVVLGRHQSNPYNANQDFYVTIKTGLSFDLVLEAMNLINGEITLIQVN